MPVRLHHIVIDAHDLPRLARFWSQALGWKILSERDREIVIGTDESAPVGMCFMPVTDPKTVKNRMHLDLTSSEQDRDQEIKRLLALGARRVDIGRISQAELDVDRRCDADQLGNLVVADETADVVRRLDVDVERHVDDGADSGDLGQGQVGR